MLLISKVMEGGILENQSCKESTVAWCNSYRVLTKGRSVSCVSVSFSPGCKHAYAGFANRLHPGHMLLGIPQLSRMTNHIPLSGADPTSISLTCSAKT